MKEGRTYMVDILNSASTFQVIDIKIKALEEERLLILKNQARFIKKASSQRRSKKNLQPTRKPKQSFSTNGLQRSKS
jgi:hypothetical protein